MPTTSTRTCKQVIKLDVMLSDAPYMQYMRRQNLEHVKSQIESLTSLMKYVEDEGLLPVNQGGV